MDRRHGHLPPSDRGRGSFYHPPTTCSPPNRYLHAVENGSRPSTLAFLALTYHRHHQPDKAQEALARLREMLKAEPWASRLPNLSPDLRALYAEAEALIEGK